MRRATLLGCMVLGAAWLGQANGEPPAAGAQGHVHLFILSGQSNMVGLNPALSFTPALTNAFSGVRTGARFAKFRLPSSGPNRVRRGWTPTT